MWYIYFHRQTKPRLGRPLQDVSRRVPCNISGHVGPQHGLEDAGHPLQHTFICEKFNAVLWTTYNNFSNSSSEDYGLGATALETSSAFPNPGSQCYWAGLEEAEELMSCHPARRAWELARSPPCTFYKIMSVPNKDFKVNNLQKWTFRGFLGKTSFRPASKWCHSCRTVQPKRSCSQACGSLA